MMKNLISIVLLPVIIIVDEVLKLIVAILESWLILFGGINPYELNKNYLSALFLVIIQVLVILFLLFKLFW